MNYSVTFFKLAYTYLKMAICASNWYRFLFRPRYFPLPFNMVVRTTQYLRVDFSLNLPVSIVHTAVIPDSIYTAVTIYIVCRNTAILDLDSRCIYQASNGLFFVYQKLLTDSQELGIIAVPRLATKTPNVPDLTTSFNLNAETTVASIEQTNTKDELERLRLLNKLILLQYSAYNQGLTESELYKNNSHVVESVI